MKKDYKKILKHIYLTKPYEPVIVKVPKLKYLMVSGSGHPSDESFQMAAQTLFPVAYISKFILKAENPEEDFTVMPMEVKWKLDRTQHGSKRYYWTMMIMQPETITKAIIKEAIDTVIRKKKLLPFNDRLRLQSFNEGLCGQIFHVGPYSDPMEQTFRILKDKLGEENYEWEPDSHDVYYNDTRNTPEEKLKTMIRIRIWEKGADRELADLFQSWQN